MSKLFCPVCMKKDKKAVLTFTLIYLKKKKWLKPDRHRYCENCKGYFKERQCVTGHFYNTEFKRG